MRPARFTRRLRGAGAHFDRRRFPLPAFKGKDR
jgi:hypothetical protein